jgi:hypothetical protein
MYAHGGNEKNAVSLIDEIQKYLLDRGEYHPDEEQTFSPALCNRIDRNTEGLVIAAKNAQALRVMNAAIRDRQVQKAYLAITAAPLPKRSDVCTAWLKKDSRQNMVKVLDSPPDKSWQKIRTGYRVLAQNGSRQLVHIDLFTGRTHQIRAHFAHLGAPLLGDPKYATGRSAEENQCLCAYALTFSGLEDSCLSHLSGKCITANVRKFVRRYFPDFRFGRFVLGFLCFPRSAGSSSFFCLRCRLFLFRCGFRFFFMGEHCLFHADNFRFIGIERFFRIECLHITLCLDGHSLFIQTLIDKLTANGVNDCKHR